MGFCLTNHAAVAAGHALSRGLDRVAILTGTCTMATAHRTSSTAMDASSTSRCIRVPSTPGRARREVGKEKGVASR